MKQKFKCRCGHEEEHHNFDPWSAFFGCCEKFYIEEYDEIHCKCNGFKPDNLTYLEEAYVHKRSKV